MARRVPPHPTSKDKDGRPTLRERLQSLRYIVPLLRLVWETNASYTVGVIVLRLVRAMVPVATLWVGKLIIDAVLALRAAAPGARDWTHLWQLVAIEAAIVVAGELLARTTQVLDGLLGDQFSNRVSVRLMEHSATLDLAYFEDPTFYDHLERARRHTTGRITLLVQVLGMAQSALTLLSLGGALVAFSPWLLLLLATATLPAFLGETHFAALRYSLIYRWTPQRRQLDYARFVGASDETAKEVQIFGLAPWLIQRFRALAERFQAENRKLALKQGVVSSLLSMIGTAGYYGAYVVIIAKAVAGAISVGSLTFLAASFARSRDLVQSLLFGASDIHEQSLYLKDLFTFLEMKPTIASTPGAPMVPRPIARGFVFEDVGFRYPGNERWAIRHASFSLAPGERIALVGENGAGKTTITKLIARLYDPTEGRILLDGVDLRDYDLASLRDAIGVIFQDFVRYDMRLDENIGVGEIELTRGYLDQAEVSEVATAVEPVPATIVDAAQQSLASSLLPRLPGGYRQMLGRRFDNGVDLSGGEWQKVALARAYLRDAQLLILDEPTAALDARAEYEVFTRFAELMRDRMAILVSHRFSTVRMADRIIVLQHGKVVEEGTHETLVTNGGLYAELFAMQAEGYR